MKTILYCLYQAAWAFMVRNRLVMFCCDGPDTSGQVAMAQANERVGMRAMDLAEKQYGDTKELQAEFMDIIRSNAVSEQEVKDLQMELMTDEQQRRQEVFNPLEAGLVEEAKNFDSAARVENEMGKADAAVVQAYDRALQSAGRDQLRLGVNPNSAKALALRENGALGLAKSAAEASTSAGERAKAKGFAMRMDAAGLGRNLATNQTAAADSALRAGQSQVSGMNSGIAVGDNAARTAQSGFGTASSAYTNAGKLYGEAAEAEASGNPMNQIANVAGYGLKTYMSQGTVC